MLRMIGYYSFGRRDDKIIEKIKYNFEEKSPNEIFLPHVKFLTFEQDGLFLDYQMVANEDAKNFYFIDKKNKSACFVTGNIFTFEKQAKIYLSGTNKAEFILAQDKKYGLNFIKYLRGEFNILLVKREKIYLINDQLGLSPMYIYKRKKGVLFCNSDEHLIWADKTNSLDLTSIAEFLVYGFVPDGKTFIRDLANQEGGSIIKINKKSIKSNKYFYQKKSRLKYLTHFQKLRLLKDTFQNAVSMRAQTNKCYANLSGGWDTRFVLANLLELHKDVDVFTSKTKKEDVVISKKISKTLNLRHILYHPIPVPESKKINQRFRFKLQNNLDNKILTKPQFRGVFGTELFGIIPSIFLKRFLLKFKDVASSIFEKDFLVLICHNKKTSDLAATGTIKHQDSIPALFLKHVGRSYLNICYASNWERPTKFFNYYSLLPFVDLDFVNSLSLLKYPHDFNYKTYQEIYVKFFPEFLTFPWTYAQYRIENNLIKTQSSINKTGVEANDRQRYIKLMKTNKKFRIFIKNNRFIIKDIEVILPRLKELYFLYEWFEAHKGVLAKEQFEIL